MYCVGSWQSNHRFGAFVLQKILKSIFHLSEFLFSQLVLTELRIYFVMKFYLMGKFNDIFKIRTIRSCKKRNFENWYKNALTKFI